MYHIIEYTDFYQSECGFDIDLGVQEIVSRYCNNFELTEDEKAELEQYWLIENFDEFTIIYDGDKYHLESKY